MQHIAFPNNFRIEIHSLQRCYHDTRLYLSVPSLILPFSVQTTATRDDIDTIISTSVGLGVGTAPNFETLQRFVKFFKREKTEDSVQVRDQRRIVFIGLLV